MSKLWEFLIHGCWHDWRARTANQLVWPVTKTAKGMRYTYQCEKCQRIKKLDIT